MRIEAAMFVDEDCVETESRCCVFPLIIILNSTSRNFSVCFIVDVRIHTIKHAIKHTTKDTIKSCMFFVCFIAVVRTA